MAEGVLFNIAEQILGNLASEALKNTRLPSGVKNELRKLEATLSTVKAVLVDAEEKQQTNNQVRVWLEMLEDVVYDADNLVEEFHYEELRRKRRKKLSVSSFFSSSNHLAFRLKTCRRMREIREKLEGIKANKSFHLEERLEEARSPCAMSVRETCSFVPDDEVIGRDEDKKAVQEVLLDCSQTKENVSMIPIVGIGGLGKTTLAQLVFNDEKVQNHFEKRIWVCVSDVFDVKSLVEKIIMSLTCESPDQDLGMEQLQNRLRKEIQGRRYLLVLDDVWNEDGERWLRLERLLRGGARGSKVLITTRSEVVAKITKTVQPFMLRGLDEDKSWALFQRMAFEKGKEPVVSSRLTETGKEIVDKCKGVPLAIKTIGRLLQTRERNSWNPKKEWMLFKNCELARLEDQSESDIIPTLKLSYNNLPSHLKHCFALCGLFPKDHEIEVQKLINIWIAQDFVKPRDRSQSCLEDVGYEYFMDLLWRSFFQEAKVDKLGIIKSCKMHDLMHDLAISVAGKGITVLDQSRCRFGSMDSSMVDRNKESFRHIYVHSECDALCQILESNLLVRKNTRTLVFSKFVRFDASSLDAVFSSLKFLRALTLGGTDIETLPCGVCKLKHLKYLDLSNNKKIKALPSCITRLHNLQTLVLSGCTKLVRLPQGIKKLTNLRHLEIDGCWSLTHIPRGLGELTCLRTLTWFPTVSSKGVSKESSGLRELNKLNLLQGCLAITLGYGKEVASESKAADLKAKKHLESLYLYWDNNEADNDYVEDIMENVEMTLEGLQAPEQIKALEVYNYMGMRLCTWLSSLNDLVILRLEYCKTLQDLPPLHCLSSLKELTLRDLISLEYVNGDRFSTSYLSSSPMPFFPSLEKLSIINCYNLKGWWKMKRGNVDDKDEVVGSTTENYQHQPSFCNLSHLSLSKCPALTSMPLFPTLEILELYKTSFNSLARTMMMGNEISLLELHSSSFLPLSKLKLLNIFSVADVETLPEMIGNLSSLQSLDICVCPNLSSLPDEIGSLSSLSFLRINACYELVSLPEGISNLTSLQSLHIQGCSNLASLPEGIGKLTSLQSLQIWNFHNLVSLPDGISNLMSLRSLDIQFCRNLLSLPEGLYKLSSLESLKVRRCTNLASLPEGVSHISSLESLVVEGCTNLATIPRGIGNLPSLKFVNGQECNELGTHFSMDTLADYLLDEQQR